MKKIVGIMLLGMLLLGNINIVFGACPSGQFSCGGISCCDSTTENCEDGMCVQKSVTVQPGGTQQGNNDPTTPVPGSDQGQQVNLDPNNAGGGGIYDSRSTNTNGTAPDTTVNGITIGETCLINGQCKFNIYETLGIRKSTGGDTSVGLFVQDIVLSATFFIGTVVTVAIIVSGLMYIFAAASGKDPTKAKNGLIYSLVGLAIVASSYFIIRLIQYLAKGV